MIYFLIFYILNRINFNIDSIYKKLYSKDNGYVNVSLLNNYTLLLTNDVAQSDETISDKELSVAYKLSDSVRDKLLLQIILFLPYNDVVSFRNTNHFLRSSLNRRILL